MQTIQALRERRAELARQMNDLVSNTPAAKWDKATHGTQYDAAVDELTAVDAGIVRFNKLAELAREENDIAVTRDAIDRKTPAANRSRAVQVFDRFVRVGYNGMSGEEMAEFRNTMSTTTTTQGGHAVPTEVARTIVDALKDYTGVRNVANVIQTEGFGPLNFPTSDGTSEVGELIGENTTATAADPSFGVVGITAYKFSSKIIAIPYELLQDAAVDMESFIRQRIVDRLGRVTNQYFTTGTGSSQPSGVVTGAGSGKVGTSGQTLTVIFDDLVDLVHSVDPAYRKSTSCQFMMNDASFKIVRKIKDTQGRPIFIPGWDGLGRAMPDTILGFAVDTNPDVATMAANAKSILFGDFSKYVVRDVMGLTLFRFEDSAYAKLGQVGFLAWLRSGGALVDVGAVRYYANSAT